MKRVTVHSDGTGTGTIILDEDGKEITGVAGVDIFIAANEPNTATLTIHLTQTNVTADVKTVEGVCPCCNKRLEHKCEVVLGSKQPDDEVMHLQVVGLNLPLVNASDVSAAGTFKTFNALNSYGGILSVKKMDT